MVISGWKVTGFALLDRLNAYLFHVHDDDTAADIISAEKDKPVEDNAR